MIQKAMNALGLRTPQVINLDNLESSRRGGPIPDQVNDMVAADGSFMLFFSRNSRTVAEAKTAINLQKREPETIELQPYTSLELAVISLQMIAAKVRLSSQISVELVAKAIEQRWCDGERRIRSVYLATDMAEYLTSEVTLGEAFTKGSVSAAMVDNFAHSVETRRCSRVG